MVYGMNSVQFLIFLIFSTCSFAQDGEVRDSLGSASQLDPGISSNDIITINGDESEEDVAKKGIQIVERGTDYLGSFIKTENAPFPFNFLSVFKSNLEKAKNELYQNPTGEKKDGNETSSFSLLKEMRESRMRHNNLNGPHICVKEITSNENIEDLKLKCDRYRDASVCTSKSRSGKVTKRIQYCCDGYTTDDIKENGCDTEISDELLSSYNISRSDAPNNSTLLFTQIDDKTYILPGIQNVFEWNDKQIIEISEKERFVVGQYKNDITETYLNCASKKETIKLENSQILRFDGILKPAADNLLEIITQNSELSTFYKVLGGDLQKVLNETKSATVFAFTNEAFDKLPEEMRMQILSSDKNDCIQEIMKQHITTDGTYCSNIPSHVKSLHGTTMSIRKNESTLMIEDAQIIDSSGFALNGVVHIIDRLLVRDNFLSWRDTLRSFNFELAYQLENTNITLPGTIFIPPKAENDTNIENPQNYLVSNRLISNFTLIENFVTDANSTIFTGVISEDDDDDYVSFLSIRIRRKDRSSSKPVRIGCSKFSAPSIYSCKTIIHFLDKPLPIVTKTVEKYIKSRKDLSMFAKIWKKSKVSLNSTSRITVFAPTNGAFSSNVLKKILKNQETAESFVNRHMVKSILCGSDIEKSKKEYTSIGGQTLTSTYDEEQFAINDANIQELELVQSNGVVHVLESFIEPTSESSRKSEKNEMIRGPFSIFSQLGSNSKSSSKSGMPVNPFALFPFIG